MNKYDKIRLEPVSCLFFVCLKWNLPLDFSGKYSTVPECLYLTQFTKF